MTTEDTTEDPDDQLEGLSSLTDSVRLALYRFAADKAGVSRDEAGQAVGISRSLAAYHLDKLVESGLLEVRFERRSGRQGPGAGRPAKIYLPSRRQFQVSVPPRDYEVAAQLLAEALDSDAGTPARDVLRGQARSLGKTLGNEARRRCRGDQVVKSVSDVLAARGYEPYDDGGVVRLRNCPFHTLATEHRDLICGMNLALLDGLVSALGTETIHPRLDPRPNECCVAFETAKPEPHKVKETT